MDVQIEGGDGLGAEGLRLRRDSGEARLPAPAGTAVPRPGVAHRVAHWLDGGEHDPESAVSARVMVARAALAWLASRRYHLLLAVVALATIVGIIAVRIYHAPSDDLHDVWLDGRAHTQALRDIALLPRHHGALDYMVAHPQALLRVAPADFAAGAVSVPWRGYDARVVLSRLDKAMRAAMDEHSCLTALEFGLPLNATAFHHGRDVLVCFNLRVVSHSEDTSQYRVPHTALGWPRPEVLYSASYSVGIEYEDATGATHRGLNVLRAEAACIEASAVLGHGYAAGLLRM